jgi:hypothetical protein
MRDDEGAKTAFAWWSLVTGAVLCVVLGSLTLAGLLEFPKILGGVAIVAGLVGGTSLPGLRQYLK